jgi:hypothetical protein
VVQVIVAILFSSGEYTGAIGIVLSGALSYGKCWELESGVTRVTGLQEDVVRTAFSAQVLRHNI